MMRTYDTDVILLGDDDREPWDTFVASSPYGHVLQSWQWGNIKARHGWIPYRLGLTDGRDLCAAAQILVRPLPYDAGRLAYVAKGPVLDYGNPLILHAMTEALTTFANEAGVISLKIEPEVTEPTSLPERLIDAGFKPAPPVQMRSTIWVDLRPDEDEILARQKQKTRYNTRLAQRKGVTVRQGDTSDMAAWYAMYHATAMRDGFSVHEQKYYCDVLRSLQNAKLATLLLAHHDGDLLAGIVVFHMGDKAIYMYGASSNEKRNLMAPYLLQWEGMRWAKSEGAAIYDLWGIPDRLEESEDLWGVYRHKRGYGGEIVRYVGAFDSVRSPIRHAALERIVRPVLKRVAHAGA